MESEVLYCNLKYSHDDLDPRNEDSEWLITQNLVINLTEYARVHMRMFLIYIKKWN